MQFVGGYKANPSTPRREARVVCVVVKVIQSRVCSSRVIRVESAGCLEMQVILLKLRNLGEHSLQQIFQKNNLNLSLGKYFERGKFIQNTGRTCIYPNRFED